MLKFRKWDKKEAVNGVAAKTLLAKNPRWSNTTIYLLFDDNVPERILRIEEASILRANGGYSAEVKDDDIITAFVAELSAPAPDVAANDNELAIMEALATIYEQNLQILNK